MTAPAHTPALREPVDHALRLLEQQSEAVGRLWALSEQQRELIEKGETLELLRLLPMRRRWIETIRAISQRLKPHQGLLASAESAGAPALLRQARSMHQQVSRRLEDLQKRDQQDCAALEVARKAVADERTRLSAGQNAARAYRPGAGAATGNPYSPSNGKPAPRFADRVG
ncbi:MAG: hypothetical protein AAF288_03840 [Planctomycetota bacterium]